MEVSRRTARKHAMNASSAEIGALRVVAEGPPDFAAFE